VGLNNSPQDLKKPGQKGTKELGRGYRRDVLKITRRIVAAKDGKPPGSEKRLEESSHGPFTCNASRRGVIMTTKGRTLEKKVRNTP